jgi:hypothetical protein
VDISPSGLAPLQSMTRAAAHRRAALTRFLIPKRNPAIEIHHSRAFACPGHVAPSRLPCVSAPYSLDGLPGIAFNQVRSRDPRPSELDLTAVAARLSAPAVPLAIDHAGPLSTLIRSAVLRTSRSRPRFRACPVVGWGPRARMFTAHASPGSPGFRLPGALPFHALTCRLERYPSSASARAPSSAGRMLGIRRKTAFGLTLSHFREGTLAGPCSLCLRVSKNRWK